jgi:hypothetical protein
LPATDVLRFPCLSFFFPPFHRNLSGIATCGFFSRDCLYSFLALPDTGKIDYADLTFPRNRSFVFLGANQVRLQKVTYSNIFMTSILEPQKPGRTVNYSADALGMSEGGSLLGVISSDSY